WAPRSRGPCGSFVALLAVRHPGEPRSFPHPAADRPSRHAAPGLARRNVLHYTSSGAHPSPVADGYMVRHTGASAELHAIADDDAAGDACVGRHDAVATDADVVGDLHLIVDLGVFTNRGVVKGAA